MGRPDDRAGVALDVDDAALHRYGDRMGAVAGAQLREDSYE